jgi:hypothetical protein
MTTNYGASYTILQIRPLKLLFLILFVISCYSSKKSKANEEEKTLATKYLPQNKSTNSSSFSSQWDMSNIPEEILMSSTTIEEILEVMATRKYRSCKGNVLYHPFKNIFYFRNPSVQKKGRGTGSLKEYMSLKCKSMKSRLVSTRQRFLIPFKDLEQLLDNNEDSIFLEGIHEITDLRNGLEMSLFPVKFYKALQMPETNYSEGKDLLCYDSIKVLGIDKNNFDYFIVSAMDRHRILYCDSTDLSKKNNLNNFIRYSAYCDEFCAEDFIYFSNDLIKCKCDFFSYVEDLKKNKNFITKNNVTEGCYYARRLDRYEIFANPYEIAEKLLKHETQNRSYQRYYLHLIIILFTFQILYAFYFTTKNSVFIKFTIIVYIVLTVIVYVPHRLKFSQIDLFKISEVITDLYPIILLVFISCDPNTKQYDILKLSYLIFVNSLDFILKETQINEIELVIRLIFIIFSFVLSNTIEYTNSSNYLQYYNLNIRTKILFEFFSRFFLYLAENNLFADISVPLFILLGRPKESHIHSDHLLFQSNYLKLKPNFDKLYENWFMEALNFHKFKNMIMFLKFARYSLVILILTCLNVPQETNRIFSLFTQMKFYNILVIFLSIGLLNATNFYFNTSQLLNSLHVPIVISLMFSNVLLTKDCLKLFLIHFFVGFVVNILSDDNKRKLRRNSNEMQQLIVNRNGVIN